MLDNEIDFYEPLIGKQFLIDRFGSNFGRRLSTPEKGVIRAIKILSEYKSTGAVKPLKQKILFHGEIGILMQQFIETCRSRRLVSESISRYELTLYKFFCYLEDKNAYSIKDITSAHILLYFERLDIQTKALIHNAILVLKQFFSYLYDHHYSDVNQSLIIPRHNIREQPKLPSTYTKNEIEKLLQSIDRGCDLGKRNYAILLLAARLGLRASDIAGLKFENIKWDGNTIELNQLKTGKRIELPLLTEIGNAIIDYLKHVRPQSEESHVFLRVKAPFTRLYNGAITCIVHNSLVL